jgi:hypothetical protein
MPISRHVRITRHAISPRFAIKTLVTSIVKLRISGIIVEMRTIRLTNAGLAFLLTLFSGACGRKGDPIPRPRAEPQAPAAHWVALRQLEVSLPARDARGESMVGLEMLRVFYLPMSPVKPGPRDIVSRGEVVVERRRPNLPSPGKRMRIDMSDLMRPQGWMVVVAVRVGDVAGPPSDTLVWLDPAL